MALRTQSVKSAVINFSSSGDNTVIAAVSGVSINVKGLFFTVHAATNITYKDGTTALSGAVEFAALGSQTLQIQDDTYFYCQPGDAFVMNNSNAVQVSGTIYYTQP